MLMLVLLLVLMLLLTPPHPLILVQTLIQVPHLIEREMLQQVLQIEIIERKVAWRGLRKVEMRSSERMILIVTVIVGVVAVSVDLRVGWKMKLLCRNVVELVLCLWLKKMLLLLWWPWVSRMSVGSIGDRKPDSRLRHQLSSLTVARWCRRGRITKTSTSTSPRKGFNRYDWERAIRFVAGFQLPD